MEITFKLSEEEYNGFIQWVVQLMANSNPILQKIATQANAQIQAKAVEVKSPEVVKPEGRTEPKPVPSFEQRERR